MPDQSERESAGDDLAAIVPAVRLRDRVGFDVPVIEVGVPAAVNRPESAIGSPDVEECGVAIDQKVTLLALALLFHHLPHVGEVSLGDLLATQLLDDRLIDGALLQAMHPQLGSGDVQFALSVLAEEVALEVITEPAEADAVGRVLGDEVGLGREGLDRGKGDGSHRLENSTRRLLLCGPIRLSGIEPPFDDALQGPIDKPRIERRPVGQLELPLNLPTLVSDSQSLIARDNELFRRHDNRLHLTRHPSSAWYTELDKSVCDAFIAAVWNGNNLNHSKLRLYLINSLSRYLIVTYTYTIQWAFCQ